MRRNWPWFMLIMTAFLLMAGTLYLRGALAPEKGGVGGPPADSQPLLRRSEAGGVEAGVEFLAPDTTENSGFLSFRVGLSTHSVSLTKFDLTRMTSVTTEAGTRSDGFSWEGLAESDHHRTGILKIDNRNPEGKALWTPESGRLVLEIKNLAVPARSFSWTAADWRR